MQSGVKNIIRHIVAEELYLSLIVDKVGEGKFKDDSFQQISDKAEKNQDFYLDVEGEQSDIKSIKTAPFNSCINVGPAKRPPTSNLKPSLTVAGYSFVFGLNNGGKTMQIIEGKICRAVGTNIFLDGSIYFGHNYEISLLSYQKQKMQLCSGSAGRCAEIIEWKCQQQGGKIKLSMLRKWNQPLKSLTVGFTAYINDNLVSITKFSLHQSSSLFILDSLSNKRINCEVKLGKVRNIICGNQLVVINERGVNILSIDSDYTCSMEAVYEKQDISSCAASENNFRQILIGLLDGQVQLLSEKFVHPVQPCLVHDGWIVSIQFVSNVRFVSAGGSDKKLILSAIDYKDKKIVKLQEIQLEVTCRNIIICENQIFCSMKNGSIECYTFQSDTLSKKNTQNQSKMIYNDGSAEVRQNIVFNKYSQKYLYSLSNQTTVLFFQVDQEFTLQNVSSANLKNTPLLIDMHANIMAYIHTQIQRPKPQSKIKSSQKQIKDSTLYLEDFTQQAILAAVELPSDQTCTSLQFNPSGDRLALGLLNGVVVVYDTNKASNPTLLCESSRKGKCHSSAIVQLIWSSDGKYLKTVSDDNLLFYELSYSNNKKCSELTVSSGSGVKEAEWTCLGKFGWQSQKIWGRADNVTQYGSMEESQRYLFACGSDGTMRVYSNPAGTIYQQLGRWFYGGYSCEVMEVEDEKIGLIITGGNGIIFGVELSEMEELPV